MKLAAPALATALLLAACGGGGGGGGAPQASEPQPPASTPTPTPTPTTPTPTPTPDEPDSESSFLQNVYELPGGLMFVENGLAAFPSWYSNPYVDLPKDGTDGLRVERPDQGVKAPPVLGFSDTLLSLLEPVYDDIAVANVTTFADKIWRTANQAYAQWTRHLDYDPLPPVLQIGQEGALTCHNRGLACYNHRSNAVILNDQWVLKVYDYYIDSLDGLDFDPDAQEAWEAVTEHLFFVLSHEAGHQFGYYNPNGIANGCGGAHGCHASWGSGSVISYDHQRGRSVRYGVTEEDIRHVPNATWNDDEDDFYLVEKDGSDSSGVTAWGIWIRQVITVEGQTDPGYLSGGDFFVGDWIAAGSYVDGFPSNTPPTGNATYSGTDNFLGVDMDNSLESNYLGALLRADANLRYTFSSNTMSLHINNFEAHYAKDGPATWHDHEFSGWGDFRYNLQCTSGGCSGDGVQTQWYPDTTANDPSGWVGGVVDDPDNSYVGSFVAEKD